jgi:UDP:flavonoid glycosyltransferase YjiC (YdhE family)
MLRTTILKVLHDSRYRRAAAAMSQAIARTGGSAQAAAITEEAIIRKQPVLRSRKDRGARAAGGGTA